MAVNLLSLAGALGKTLHNTPTSTKRSNSYAPGTVYGNKIPGTNLKKGAGLKNLAAKGRTFGGVKDTKIRKVKGRASHVNKREASIIDLLGPLGEAWVDKVGSGTINPQTGMKEYGLFKGGALKPSKKLKKTWDKTVGKEGLGGLVTGQVNIGDALGNMYSGVTNIPSSVGGALLGGTGVWKPSEGKWGIFGQTSGADERDDAKASATASHNMFEDFRREYEDENIAGIFTADENDNTDKTGSYAGNTGYEDFIKTNSGLNIKENDIADYTDEYDERKETELTDSLGRDLEAMDIAGEALDAKREGIGTGLSSGLFGMLTQSQDSTSQKGFAGSGDFAADFAKKQAIKEAESQFGGADRDAKSLGLEKQDALATTISATEDLHEDYNQEFWNNMVSWDSAVNT